MITNKIKSTIYKQKLINKGEHIVVGLSGGPDSMCLFHALLMLREEFEITLYAVHINHQFRGVEADKDQKFVEEYCNKVNVNCYSYSIDVNAYAKEQGVSSEEAGRKIRYQCFYKVAEKIKAAYKDTNITVKIAVAQNLNDQAETVLMRIIRGTGVDGLAGIEYKRMGSKKVEIIRPLLDIKRDEIESYCAKENLEPRIDHTNSQPIYTRNKVRLDLIPSLKENYNENIVMALNRLSKIAKIDKDYLTSVTEKTIRTHAKIKDPRKGLMASIPLKVMQELHPALRHRVIMNLLVQIGLSQDITSTHLAGADYIIEEGRTSAMTDFTGDYRLQVSYGLVEIFKKKNNEANSFSYMLDLSKESLSIKVGELGGAITAKVAKRERDNLELSGVDFARELLGTQWKSNYSIALSFDEILKSDFPLILRSRMQGDWIIPQGMAGKKKIQNFFVDVKIAKDERDSIPLLCLGTEVIWVVGSRISEGYKIKDETDSILLLEYLNDM